MEYENSQMSENDLITDKKYIVDSNEGDNIHLGRDLLIMAACLLAAILLNTFVGGFALVSGESMLPTLEDGNFIIVDKITEVYERFDIVILHEHSWGGPLLIKRVIGLPGDTVLIENGTVYVNGAPIEDVVSQPTDFAGIAETPITLGDKEYFVLGDNRANSRDSRYESVGIVSEKQIQGKAFYSLLLFKKIS